MSIEDRVSTLERAVSLILERLGVRVQTIEDYHARTVERVKLAKERGGLR